MTSDAAQLSALQTTLEDVADRVEEIARRRDADPDDPVGDGLFEVHRSLRNAIRRLERLRPRA